MVARLNEDAAREAKSSHRSWRYQLLLALAKTRKAERRAVYIVQHIKKVPRLFTFFPLSILAESRPDPDGERGERGRSSSHEKEVLPQRWHLDKGVSFLSQSFLSGHIYPITQEFAWTNCILNSNSNSISLSFQNFMFLVNLTQDLDMRS